MEHVPPPASVGGVLRYKMKQYVCNNTCQVRINKHITLITRGDVVELPEDHVHFTAIGDDDHGIDFTTATKEELAASTWTFEEAAAALKEAYNAEIVKEEGMRKSEVISIILDVRFRYIDPTTLS